MGSAVAGISVPGLLRAAKKGFFYSFIHQNLVNIANKPLIILISKTIILAKTILTVIKTKQHIVLLLYCNMTDVSM